MTAIMYFVFNHIEFVVSTAHSIPYKSGRWLKSVVWESHCITFLNMQALSSDSPETEKPGA